MLYLKCILQKLYIAAVEEYLHDQIVDFKIKEKLSVYVLLVFCVLETCCWIVHITDLVSLLVQDIS